MTKSKTSTQTCDPWFVYILLCENQSLYTGISKDIHKRFQQHLSGKGAKYTKIYKPVKIVYFEELENHSLAAKREIQIKSLPTHKKRELINNHLIG